MQTFLPDADYQTTARALDRARLGKQRVEAWQILRALQGLTKGWRTHPATLMWSGHDAELCRYGIAICREWIARGYQDTLLPRFEEHLSTLQEAGRDSGRPGWLGREDVHSSHRSALLRKHPDHYRFMAWSDDPAAPYVWPVTA